jgi:xanthine dehydrogenase accessory factor
MLDIFSDLEEWSKNGRLIALATVIKTWGASPRTVGAKMAVNDKGDITGSVSGGCVEGAVVSASMETIKTGNAQLLHFDVADKTAWEVGVACGGQIDVFIRLLDTELLTAFRQAIDLDEVIALSTVIDGEEKITGSEICVFPNGKWTGEIDDKLRGEIVQRTLEVLESKQPFQTQIWEGTELLIDVMPPPPTLVIVGGVHIAVALVKIAKASGYRVIVVDPRRQFGTRVRFPNADQIIQKWPDDAFEEMKINNNTAIAMLTHDPKIDDPGLLIALPSNAFYVGALGSRKTQVSRRERLLAAGLKEEYLNRIHGPIGLDLGGRSPEEIALAIMAQVVQQRYLAA